MPEKFKEAQESHKENKGIGQAWPECARPRGPCKEHITKCGIRGVFSVGGNYSLLKKHVRIDF